MPTDLQVVRTPETAAELYLHPDRLRILEALTQPHSASSVAKALDLKRQTVNYHLRQLELAGFVEFVEARKRGNCVERVLRSTSRAYVVSPRALGKVGATPETIRDRFSSAYMVAAAAKTIDDVAELRARADEAGKRLATYSLESEIQFATSESRRQFAEELSEAVEQLIRKHHTDQAPNGRKFRMFVGIHPAVAEPQERNEP